MVVKTFSAFKALSVEKIEFKSIPAGSKYSANYATPNCLTP